MNRLILLLLFVGLSSCTKTLYMGRAPQTHFSFPNANVTPLNKVRGEASKVKLMFPPMVNSTLINQAYADALSKAQDADGLINVDIYQKQTPLLIIHITKYIVEGTAVKQEVGKQKLN
jgi:hypothetical protein